MNIHITTDQNQTIANYRHGEWTGPKSIISEVINILVRVLADRPVIDKGKVIQETIGRLPVVDAVGIHMNKNESPIPGKTDISR